MIQTQPNCTDRVETGLIHFDTARANILSSVTAIGGAHRLPIEQARGRTLACAVTAPIDVPAHTNSAVDGYALRSEDLPGSGTTGRFTIVGRAFAGKPFEGELAAGQCVRIMTGAPMPAGCDTVIMQEQVERSGESILIDAAHRPGQNVRQAGEDLRRGETALPAGRLLTPPDIGLCASLGIAELPVRRKLRVAIASTGDEIFDVGAVPGNGGIYDSNRYSLLATLHRPDIEVVDLGILQDRPELLLDAFNGIADHADVIISSGGVSVGDADHIKTALQTSGQIEFWKVAIKPGRPMAFGSIGGAAFFGLPGNPVAVLVTFYLLVLPALEKMLGITDRPVAPMLKARALEPIRKRPGRTEVQRGILLRDDDGAWTVKTTGKQGSGILRSMSLADAFIILPHDSGNIDAGDWVTVQPFAGLW